MIRITDILDQVQSYNPDADLDIIERVYIYSAKAHKGQVRLSGEPYLSHPLEVAGILADMRLDIESIAAGLLHDVIEDTPTDKEDIEKIFGPKIAHIVSGVTKISKITFSTEVAHKAENLRKMILAMADDIRVILIKLADRLHNMRTLKYHRKYKKKVAIAQETLDIYAPIAARLGIFWIKHELEEMAFYYTLRNEYKKIKKMVNKAKNEKENYIKIVHHKLYNKMAETKLKCDIKGRYKQYYSIYQKMVAQSLGFEEIYDIVAFRIILDNVPQCYEAMGAIHSMWKPIYYKIKDYIGNPKPNMYQSIHTTVIGPNGERVEIQIRTHEMDRIAESGIAAHWCYKEGTKSNVATKELFAWIRQLVENQKAAAYNNPHEFLENVRIDLYQDEIYVFTPLGEIKTLPLKATPVDFAYTIHSEVGSECTGAKVNGKLVPLAHELKTGDTIQIITTKGHNPSRDWLNFVKTVKARTKIRTWINAREKERSYSLGYEMCEKIFRKKNKNFNTLIKSKEIKKVVEMFGFKKTDDLVAHVGFGKITPLQILNKMIPESEKKGKNIPRKSIGHKSKTSTGVTVKGLNDILVKFSKCCTPIPGDAITGYITRGQGVTIHRTGCINLMKMGHERQIDVEWSKDSTESYPASIKIQTYDRFGLLADIASVITKNKSNILSAKTKITETGICFFYFTILVENSDQISKIMLDIRKVKKVNYIKRLITNP